MDLKIAYLYPTLMNIYGDGGNILTLEYRCHQRGIDVEIDPISLDDEINPDKYDFYFMGGGQDKQQFHVAQDLQNKKNSLKQAVHNGATFLLICGGYQLFGHYYKPYAGKELRGISLLDLYTVGGQTRFIGNVTIKLDHKLGDLDTITGFENHSGLTYLGENLRPLGYVKTGNGNNGKDKQEGCHEGNIFGTYLHGPILPKNPHFADYLLDRALARRYTKIKLEPLNDRVEIMAHQQAMSRSYY